MPEEAVKQDGTDTIKDADRDALHVLPLTILPLTTPSLSRARMIKNHRMISAVELFADNSSGSGQLEIEDLPKEFDWDDPNGNPDMVIMRNVAKLFSYDVFSLRITLRQLQITVEDHTTLKLSESMNRELTTYMADFTRPLVLEIYGKDDMDVQSFEDMIKLFRDPDVKKALEKLKMMADTLGIRLDDVPAFLEDYGDIFLSLSYYRRCLDDIEPIIQEFMGATEDLRSNFTLKHDQNLMRTINSLQNMATRLTAALHDRFRAFDKASANMWEDMSAAKFQRLRQEIAGYHTFLGGMLCALTVKMSAWDRLFPRREIGGPQKRAEFLLTEMRQGMDNIRRIEAQTLVAAS